MIGKIVLLIVACLLAAHAISIDKVMDPLDSDEVKKVDILESLKEFVRLVDKYNLNVSIIGSHEKYSSGDILENSLAMTVHLPVNDEHLTEASLDDVKQDKYLKKLEVLGNKEHTGAKTRVFTYTNGFDEINATHSVHSNYIINSGSYGHWKPLTSVYGELLDIDTNETSELLYNYHIKHPSDDVKNVQIVTANVVINEIGASDDFPENVKGDLNKILPELWLSIDDETILARVLTNHLDKHFDGSFQAFTGINQFALGGKEYIHLKVGDTNIVVFIN